ncbi:hypothetical protein V6617_01315 [Pelagibacterium nitratireducens]|uniref:Uncharacterized protein n=1 Tax=Pelagibacterium nitratireducens TaxID=1046114 RepID=A0ABZ2I4K6_9HYPH
MRSAVKALFFVGAGMLLPTGMASPALASWQASNDGQGLISAQACVDSSVQCARLQCLAMPGGGVYWYIDAPEPGYSAESAAVTWTIDAHSFTPLEMAKAGPAEGGMQSYEAAFDQAEHQTLVEALKSGNQLTVSSDQFASITISLRGSGNALTQTLVDCPLTGAEDWESESIPMATAHSSPMQAVEAMMKAQACKATESEIFNVILDSGFGTWEANNSVVAWAEADLIILIDKTDGVHRYRLPECKAKVQTPQQSNLVDTSYPDAIISALDEFAQACGVLNRDDVFVPEALASKDINGDGSPDYILDFKKLFCGGGQNMFCGAQMCELAVYASHGSGYVSERYLGFGAYFSDDAILAPCAGTSTPATIRYVEGSLIRDLCQ